ncbi:MAG TPA: SUMF1/EgtB/PvdO family nonheme iron enzyme, partial [Bryobacteraceae bacterium]
MSESKEHRYAILIGSSEFPKDPSLKVLRCPKNDAEGLAAVLTSPDFGLFTEQQVFVNEPHGGVARAVNRVFKAARWQDQILVYYSGHGILDNEGHLHLAMTDTEVDALEATAMPVEFLRKLFNNHRCKRVAIILDCCYSGAVSKDLLKSVVNDQLQVMRGIYVLTASTASQPAREKDGDRYSLLTKHIINGISQGEADDDQDGFVSMDDLFNYVTARVPQEAPQYPVKYELGVQGHQLFIARSFRVFSSAQLRVFKEKLKSVEESLPSRVFLQAYKIIDDNEPRRDAGFFALLDDLCEGRLRIGDFVSKWLDPLSPSQPASPAASATTTAPKKPAALELPASFTENLNDVELTMILIPGGRFKMGSLVPYGDGYDFERERPEHEVTVPGFHIGKYQVTQAQWEAVIGDHISHFKGDGNLPVENVSWHDAKEFCKKLSRMTGNPYRLPSEAEWEYACRAGTTGDFAGNLGNMAWYRSNSDSTHPVGEKQPNAFGLYDMHGNVW